jgi:hypothetical protein
MLNKGVIKMEYREALINFLSKVQERENIHENTVGKTQFPMLEPSPATFHVIKGRKFDKVVRKSKGNNESVYAFINKETGGIIKPAGWKQPEPNKLERGNIFNEDCLAGTNRYGVDYIRYDNTPYK